MGLILVLYIRRRWCVSSLLASLGPQSRIPSHWHGKCPAHMKVRLCPLVDGFALGYEAANRCLRQRAGTDTPMLEGHARLRLNRALFVGWSRRSAVPGAAQAVAKTASCAAGIPPVPRIALMFLTRGALPYEPLWAEWFRGAVGLLPTEQLQVTATELLVDEELSMVLLPSARLTLYQQSCLVVHRIFW